ncbi:MAG: NADH dehydrogenase [Candidatus Hydrogenedentota bacterium]
MQAVPDTDDDPLLEELTEILHDYPAGDRSSLIPILQDVQEHLGYLSRDSIAAISEYLHLPASKIYGVATFYNQFRFQPLGKCHYQVCRGTACHVKGSLGVLDALKQEIGVEPGQTRRDGQYSLEVVACVGACGLAPVVVQNGEFHAGVTTKSVRDLVADWQEAGMES